METELVARRAFALITSGKATRDDQLARALDSDTATIAAALAPECASGALVSCRIDRVGSTPVNEYRVSAAGPRKADESHLKKPPTPPERVLAAAKAAPVPAPHRSVPLQHNAGDATMSVSERILAAYKKHGPMTTRQLSEHVDAAWVSITCSQLAKQGKLVRLGGGAHSTIYGLPGQKLPKGDAVATAPAKPKKAAKVAAKKRSKTKRKVQRNTATSAARPAGPHLRIRNAELRLGNAGAGKQFSTFRTAIASDGAMIFLGAAAGPFELTRPESRALIEFVRTLDAGKLAA